VYLTDAADPGGPILPPPTLESVIAADEISRKSEQDEQETNPAVMLLTPRARRQSD
jgi:hypothetical protein